MVFIEFLAGPEEASNLADAPSEDIYLGIIFDNKVLILI
jgi:hypothetical protein